MLKGEAQSQAQYLRWLHTPKLNVELKLGKTNVSQNGGQAEGDPHPHSWGLQVRVGVVMGVASDAQSDTKTDFKADVQF